MGSDQKLGEYAVKLSARIDALRSGGPATDMAAFRRFADMIPQVIWTASPAGEVTFLNVRWHEFFGATDDWLSIIHSEDRQATLDAWGNAIATGQPYWNTARFRDANGDFHRVVTRAKPVRDDSARILYWVGSTAVAGPAEALLQVA